jgi:hypothetical protein
MFDEHQAATFLRVLSRRKPLTELDAARALSSAARLLETDQVSPARAAAAASESRIAMAWCRARYGRRSLR